MTSTSDCPFLPIGLYTLPLAPTFCHSRRLRLAVYADAPYTPPAPTSLPALVRRLLPRRTSLPPGTLPRQTLHFLVSSTFHRPHSLAHLPSRLWPTPLHPRTTASRSSRRKYFACGAISTPHARKTCDVNSLLHMRRSAPSGPRRKVIRLHRRPRRSLSPLPSLIPRRPPWRPPRPPRRRSSSPRASLHPRAPPRPPALPRSCRTSSVGTLPLAATPPLGLQRRTATTTPPTSNVGDALPGPLARTARARSTAVPQASRGTPRPPPRFLPRLPARMPPGTTATRTTAAPFGRPGTRAHARPRGVAAPPAPRGLLGPRAATSLLDPPPPPRPPPPLPALPGCGGRCIRLHGRQRLPTLHRPLLPAALLSPHQCRRLPPLPRGLLNHRWTTSPAGPPRSSPSPPRPRIPVPWLLSRAPRLHPRPPPPSTSALLPPPAPPVSPCSRRGAARPHPRGATTLARPLLPGRCRARSWLPPRPASSATHGPPMTSRLLLTLLLLLVAPSCATSSPHPRRPPTSTLHLLHPKTPPPSRQTLPRRHPRPCHPLSAPRSSAPARALPPPPHLPLTSMRWISSATIGLPPVTTPRPRTPSPPSREPHLLAALIPRSCGRPFLPLLPNLPRLPPPVGSGSYIS